MATDTKPAGDTGSAFALPLRGYVRKGYQNPATGTVTAETPRMTALTPYVFGVQDVATNQSTTPLNVGGSANTVTEYIAPFDGSVVAFSVRTDRNTAASSSVTVAARIAGTRKTGTLAGTLAAASSKINNSTTNLTSFTFSAGDALEVVYDSNTTSPAVDLTAILWTI